MLSGCLRLVCAECRAVLQRISGLYPACLCLRDDQRATADRGQYCGSDTCGPNSSCRYILLLACAICCGYPRVERPIAYEGDCGSVSRAADAWPGLDRGSFPDRLFRHIVAIIPHKCRAYAKGCAEGGRYVRAVWRDAVPPNRSIA